MPKSLVIGVEIVGALMSTVVEETRLLDRLCYDLAVDGSSRQPNPLCPATLIYPVTIFHGVFSFSFLGCQSYNIVPADTSPPPAASIKLHPLPNHKILMIRLRALRAVNNRLVCTEETV